MTYTIVDSGLLAKLQQSPGPLELCDTSGRILGTFYPRATRADYDAAEHDRPKLSEEELQTAETGPTCTTAELIQHLESL
ncbi:MAG TPA: hypothetical protein VFI31_05200 [Pirellulales bacterium]|nr:hypothetical protein [Pirellulales bacterium]